MSWLWKKKEAAATADIAPADPSNRIATVAPELPILNPEREIIYFNPFDLEQRKKDMGIAPQFAAERAAYLKAKTTGQPYVSPLASASSQSQIAPVAAPEGESDAVAEETPEKWTEEDTAEPTAAASIGSPTSPEAHINEEELQKVIEEERQKVDQMVAMLGLEYPSETEDPNSQKRYKLQLDMLRFLRARRMKVEDAVIMYKAAEEWFDKEKLHSVLVTPDPLVRYFQTISPHRNHGFDYYGNPVYFERTGMVVVGDMLKYMTEDDVVRRHLRYMMYSLDRMAVSSIANKKNVGKVVMIHDLAHLKFSVEAAGIRIFKKSVTYDQNYFPERLHKAFIINAPMSFRGAWAVIKPLLDPKTQEKIVILGSNFKEALLECIPLSQIPAHYGGLCQCTFENDPNDFCLPHRVRSESDPEHEHNPEWPVIIPRNDEQLAEAKLIIAKAAAASGASSSK